MNPSITPNHYLALLQQWIPYAARDLYTPPDQPDLLCYGAGEFNWGAQTHAKAFSAFAVLAAEPDLDETVTGVSRAELLDQALRMLRYMLQSHYEGDYHCLDGKRWGHTWISVLGLERMMHAVEAIEEHLTPADQEQLRRVLVSESDWLMDHYDVKAGLVDNNKPESNLWNGAMLHRTAMMYPETPRAAEYREKGTHYLMNAISVPEDAECETIFDGRPVKDWFVGANFFSSMATNHHWYLNVGYMVICLSNVAMLHFSYKKRGIPAPKALYWHVERLWDLLKHCTFPDGRLLRIGGDTRVRYCYCQDYAIPMWLLMADMQRDAACPVFERGWLAQVQGEMENNGDGSFLSDRCAQLRDNSPLYHTRLESDRANTLSMGIYWRRVHDLVADINVEATRPTHDISWSDDYHGACLERGTNRIASFVWRAGELPTGLVLPAGRSDLAEWRHNFAGEVVGLGKRNYQVVEEHQERFFEGGFLTWGCTRFVSEDHIAEGQGAESLARNHIVFAALPDDKTVIVLQQCKTLMRAHLRSYKGLFWQVPNDLWNNYRRTYRTEDVQIEIIRREQTEPRLRALEPWQMWLNVDDCLSLHFCGDLQDRVIYSPPQRQIGLRQKDARDPFGPGGMLYADEICSPCELEPQVVDAGTILYSQSFVMRVETAEEAAAYHDNELRGLYEYDETLFTSGMARGEDGVTYYVLANFEAEAKTARVWLMGMTLLTGSHDVELPPPDERGQHTITLEPGEVRLYRSSTGEDSGDERQRPRKC